jgi:hypothetical protein
MNLQKTFSSLMTNKYFLYFIVVLSAINIIGYLTMNNTDAVIFFALLGFITFNFSKNMTIVLLVSIIATNLFMVSKPFTSFEAFTEGGTSKISTTKPGPGRGNRSGGDDVSGDMDGMTNKPSSKNMPTAKVKGIIANAKAKAKSKAKIENLSSRKNEGFDLSPAPVKKSSHIDYATTLEDAYKNLEKMLGNGGLQNLTADTKKLMDQQTQLFNSMENITPMLAQAQQMMKGMDIESMNKFAGSAKSFNRTDA